MEARNIAWVVLAFASLLVLAGIVSAQGMWSGTDRSFGMNHHQMEKMMEEGKYSDLEALREKLGFKIMPWVDNEQDFKQAQEYYAYADQRGYDDSMMGMMSGMMGSNLRMSYGCHGW